MLKIDGDITISRSVIRNLYDDPVKCAEAVRLVYVSDSLPGIRRLKKGRGFSYVMNGRPVRDAVHLERIRRLVIPPAWENVWICALENGHLQATGLDARKRKQYKYHALWSSLRNHTKFYRLHEFGKALPTIRRRIQQHLALKGLPPEKVLAVIVSVMEATSMRVGNDLYEKLYGSFGLTTLKDQHVRITGQEMQFVFTGKKGIPHRISLRNKRLAKIVKQCRDIPGKELFQYIDVDGNRRCVDSGMVNDYIRSVSGGSFTAKDFRTWTGTVQAMRCFARHEPPHNASHAKRTVVSVLDDVAKHLGNTRTVCKKYYVHPLVVSLYENGRLHKYLTGCDMSTHAPGSPEHEPAERALMTLLQKERMAA